MRYDNNIDNENTQYSYISSPSVLYHDENTNEITQEKLDLPT